MQVVLVMFRNDGERRSFSVVRNMTVIGRREDCDLRIPVSDVSRKHCRLVRTDDGIRIEDLGSSNGTFVNGERIQECDLNAGDVLGIGPVQFIVQIEGVPHDDDLEPPSAARPAEMAPPSSTATQDMGSELTELEEVPAEEFAIDEDAAALEHPADALEEVPPVDHDAAATMDLGSMDEISPLEQSFILEDEPMAESLQAEEALAEEPLAEEPLTEEPLAESEPVAETMPAAEDASLDEFELTIEPPQAEPAVSSTAPVSHASPPPSHQQSAEQPAEQIVDHEQEAFDDFDELMLDEMPGEPSTSADATVAPPAVGGVVGSMPSAAPVPPTPPAMPGDHLEELMLDDEHAPLEPMQPAPVAPLAVDPHDELQLEDELELDESAPLEPALNSEATVLEQVTPSVELPAARIESAPLELAASEPAFDEVNIESDPDEFEELTLDEAPATNGEAGESSWDFVIEEADSTRSHHDFKLDSPHEQPHG
jgi:hypothetical protein